MPFGFGKKTPTASISAPAPAAVRSGVLSLAKDESVSITKTPVITATVSWPSTTDYDVLALVQYADGSVVTVSQFGTKDSAKYTAKTADGAVVHLGDVQRGNGALADETIEIRLNPDIVAVVPFVYSAQSNGSGSFRHYRVSMTVDNGAGDVVKIDASEASDNARVYTCVPGIIINGDVVATVQRLELYSKPGSERRPALGKKLAVVMDGGPVNAYK